MEAFMSHIEDLVDQVISSFESRRRTRWHATHQPVTDVDPNLKCWHELVEERLTEFRTSAIDRATLMERVHARFKGTEWTADFAGVADELQQMARDDLQRYLGDHGVPSAAAAKIAEGYSIGALLHDSAHE
jgi:hypothetical protein